MASSLVSVLFNESKLLKSRERGVGGAVQPGFSTLQRVEIAEIGRRGRMGMVFRRFSTLQRVEIAEMPEAP